MKNTLGNVVKLTVFGESHGDAVGCVLDGIPAGLPVNEVYIQKQLMMRQSMPEISTSRRESDQLKILSGVRNGYTEGTPVTFLLENTNVRRKDYDALAGVLRPGHADYTAQLKYHGYQDASGGGHFSGRLTAPMTAAGALCRSLLENYGIVIGSHIAQLYNVQDQGLPADPEAVRKLNEKMFAVLD
ncbi:MAG: chorismate synthase, partial [Solobacterium sp.]|nr:chorismate synthase [Solobacterium sp.]